MMKSESLNAVAGIELPSASHVVPDSMNAKGPAAGILDGIEITLEAVLGNATLTIKDLMDLRPGTSVRLSRSLDQPVEIRLNQKTVAWAEIVAVDDCFGLRITELVAA